MADLACTNPARLELSVDRLRLTLKCMRRNRPISPTVLADHELRTLTMPTLYLVGEHEKIYSAVKGIERLKQVAPQIRTGMIPDAGHDGLTISQADRVN
jgi:pimeloyl-ACP methyl ester carboxylesterase